MKIVRGDEVTEITYLDKAHEAEINKHGGKFHEFYMLEAIAEMDIPKGVFVDIGAHVGNHSIFFAKYCPQCESVLAYEPSKEAFDVLEANIKTVGGIEAFREAVGETAGKCTIQKNADHPAQNTIKLSNKGKTKVVTLPTDLGAVSLIKIDVEQMEKETVKGCLEVIERDKPELFIETFGDPNDILELLPDGYRLVKRYNYAPTYHFSTSG